MKVSFLLVVLVFITTLAPHLSSSAEPQKQKRKAQSTPPPMPTPNSKKPSGSSSGKKPQFWNEPIKNVSDARRIFEAYDGSQFHMMRDEPDRWGEYWDLKIDRALEHQWRREMITKLGEQLLDPATEAKELWWLHSRLDKICTDVNDAESVLKIYEVTRRIAGRLPVQEGILVAETINGRDFYSIETGRTEQTYQTGLVYLAMKHGLRDVAQGLADHSMSLAQRAKSRKVDVARAEEAMERCLALKKHFGLK